MKILSIIFGLLLPLSSFSQLDTSFIAKLKAIDTANTLKLDTAAVPNDLLTKKIRSLRSEKHGMSIATILKIKIMEEQQKDTAHSKEFYNKLLQEVTTGRTSRLIENCLINLYRRTFTIKEIEELTAFYKTSTGKKMDTEFILLIIQSVKDTEQLLKSVAKTIQ